MHLAWWKTKRGRIVGHILLVLVPFICACLALETAYRGYRYARYGVVDHIDLYSVGYFVPDTRYGYVPAKNFDSDQVPERIRTSVYGRNYFMYTKFTTNSYGYRDEEFTPQKPEGFYRVVAFGGSTTMGIHVNDEGTWSERLQRRLNDNEYFLETVEAEEVEVLNVAVHGWRSRENLMRLQDEVQHFDPDLLLVAVTWNDPWNGVQGKDLTAPPVRNWSPWWSHSVVLQNLRVRYLNWRAYHRTAVQNRLERLNRSEPWANVYENHLSSISEIASQIDASVAFVNMPGLCRANATSAETTLIESTAVRDCNFWAEVKVFTRNLLLELSTNENVRLIDLHEGFEGFTGEQRLDLFADNMHLTASGHTETADQIAAYLVGSTSWLTGPIRP